MPSKPLTAEPHQQPEFTGKDGVPVTLRIAPATSPHFLPHGATSQALSSLESDKPVTGFLYPEL